MPVGSPQLQLRIAIGAQSREIVVPPGKQIDSAQRLRMTAVQPFGQANDGRQHSNRASKRAVQVAVALVGLFRGRLPMISRH